MSPTRQPPAPSALYDGTLYSWIFDRIERELHQRVAAFAGEAERCLDACCGTGGLSFALAEHCNEVVGVDHSPRMIARANLLRRRRNLARVSFRTGDVSALDGVVEGPFDVATASLGLHEMPAGVRARVLPELLRLAPRVVVLDFAIPMPHNIAGWRNRAIELMAGPRHFAGFRDFARRGGLLPLVAAAGSRVLRQRFMDAGTLFLAEIGR